MKREIVAVLHNIRSSHNVGSIFRTADGAGASHVVLSGYTPRPIDSFGKVNNEIAKTALGAEKVLPWRAFATIGKAMRELRAEGYMCVAIEQHERAVSLARFKPQKKIAYVFGNEVLGLSKKICEQSDAIVMIPMHGKKESLNVSVAAGIVLFHKNN